MAHEHHDHEHGHSHSVTAAQATSKAFIIGILLNLLYVFGEAIAGLLTHSLALLTDAGHNLSDVASLGLSLLAFRLAKLKPSQNFTYGYKKSTILAALTNAVILLVAVGILGYESILRIRHPQPLQGGVVAWVAALGIVINGVSAMLFFRNKHELNAKSAYLHLLADALVSVGVVIAGILIIYTHWYWLDAFVSLGVLVVILISTWSLLSDSIRLSLDAVPQNVNIEEVEKAMNTVAGVKQVSHIHIWAMSTTENALTAHLEADTELSFEEKLSVVKALKHELEHHNIQHATIELEDKQPVSGVSCHLADRQ
jgi:cobalt-zinc-cadmium efflux system protein